MSTSKAQKLATGSPIFPPDLVDDQRLSPVGQFLRKVQLDDRGLNNSTRLVWIIICCGAIFRLGQYLFNRSLWLDESWLALNIVNRSFPQLLKPLDYNQAAPVGFLMLERSVVQVFGSSEYALRLVPFLCGIISLLLFYRLAKLSVTSRAVPIALGLFAISAPLIYYSSEAKQYSSDVAIALSLLSAAVYYGSCKLTPRRVAVFGLLGAASIWFSHPAAFVLGGIGISLTVFCLAEKRWARIRRYAIAFALWASSFAACYLISLRPVSANRALLYFWSSSFPPSRLLSFSSVEWLVSTFFGMFQSAVGSELSEVSGIAAFTFLVGCISMFSNKREKLFVLISPILVTLLAASLHRYPFSGRLILFVVPALLLVIAEGAEQIRCKTRVEAPIIGACLIGLLFFHPLLFSSYHLIKPGTREEIKPVLNYLNEHKHEGDVLYVHHGAVPAFRYYAPRLDLSKMNFVPGIWYSENNWSNYEKDIDQLRGHGRVWLLFSNNYSFGVNEEKLFLYLVDRAGTRLDSFKSFGAAVYLYDLDQPNLVP
jgi:hypothetical protein